MMTNATQTETKTEVVTYRIRGIGDRTYCGKCHALPSVADSIFHARVVRSAYLGHCDRSHRSGK